MNSYTLVLTLLLAFSGSLSGSLFGWQSDHKKRVSLATDPSVKVFICTMFLEMRYIPEWLDYHRYLGFDFVQLYDNNPTFQAQNLSHTYGDFVRVTHAPEMLHWNVTEDCRVRYMHEPYWVAAIDSDEFIVLHKHDNIKQLLAEVVPDGGALSINWFLYGSNFHKRDHKGPVLERFTARAKKVHNLVKSISYLPDVKLINCHEPTLKKGIRQSDTNGHKFRGPFNRGGPTDVAQINHYVTKSEAECQRKTKHHRSDGTNHTDQYCASLDYNEVQDSSAWDLFRTKQIEEAHLTKLAAKKLEEKKTANGTSLIG